MGAYKFSADTLKITKMSTSPIIGENFYTKNSAHKKIVYPGGYALSNSTIYLAYGKDDCEIWIATIDKNALKKAMAPLSAKE